MTEESKEAESNVKNIDDYRSLCEIIGNELRKEFDTDEFMFAVKMPDGNFATYIARHMLDIDTVYGIQTLRDRRHLRWTELNDVEP